MNMYKMAPHRKYRTKNPKSLKELIVEYQFGLTEDQMQDILRKASEQRKLGQINPEELDRQRDRERAEEHAAWQRLADADAAALEHEAELDKDEDEQKGGRRRRLRKSRKSRKSRRRRYTRRR